MADVPHIGRYERVRVHAEGENVILEMPLRASQAHWTEFQAIAEAILIKCAEARGYEQMNGAPIISSSAKGK